MAICKFFQQGTCRNGNSCNFEHVSPQNKWGSSTTTAGATTAKYNESSIKVDLTEARPQWKLSNYGPAKEEPNLIVGVDRSVEEDRFLYYTSIRTAGNNTQYVASYEQLFNQVETQVNAIISNTTGALQHYEKEKSNHSGPFGGAVNHAPFAPFTNTGGAFGSTSTNAFGQASTFGSAKPSAFGQPSAFGSTTAAAKPSAFGSTSSLGGSAFGSTSTLGGGGSGSAFGSTSTLGGGSAFGSTSALGGGSAFGSTNALGGGSAFGTTNALGGTTTTSAFGQPSAFGAAAAKPSVFGGAPTTSAFGSTNALGGGSAFGSTSTLGGGGAFGTTTTAAPAFGATSGLGGSTTTAFGSTPTSVTGTSTTGAFGQPSTLGAFGTTNTTETTMDANNNSNSSTMDVKQPPASDLEAFSAPQFIYRAIPEVEPPIQLR